MTEDTGGKQRESGSKLRRVPTDDCAQLAKRQPSIIESLGYPVGDMDDATETEEQVATDPNLSVLFKLKDALDDPAKHLATAKNDPTLGPILAKLTEADIQSLGKISKGMSPLSFCNHAPT